MTQRTSDERQPQVDTGPTEHENEVAEHVRERAGSAAAGDAASTDEGRRPSSAEDLAADMTAGDESTPPHPSPAEGGSTEPAERPPRPSQAEGDR